MLGVAFEDDFELPLTNVSIEDASPSPADETFRDNVRYQLNLKVEKRLRVEFLPPTPPSLYRLGRKGGRYWIAAPVKAP